MYCTSLTAFELVCARQFPAKKSNTIKKYFFINFFFIHNDLKKLHFSHSHFHTLTIPLSLIQFPIQQLHVIATHHAPGLETDLPSISSFMPIAQWNACRRLRYIFVKRIDESFKII